MRSENGENGENGSEIELNEIRPSKDDSSDVDAAPVVNKEGQAEFNLAMESPKERENKEEKKEKAPDKSIEDVHKEILFAKMIALVMQQSFLDYLVSSYPKISNKNLEKNAQLKSAVAAKFYFIIHAALKELGSIDPDSPQTKTKQPHKDILITLIKALDAGEQEAKDLNKRNYFSSSDFKEAFENIRKAVAKCFVNGKNGLPDDFISEIEREISGLNILDTLKLHLRNIEVPILKLPQLLDKDKLDKLKIIAANHPIHSDFLKDEKEIFLIEKSSVPQGSKHLKLPPQKSKHLKSPPEIKLYYVLIEKIQELFVRHVILGYPKLLESRSTESGQAKFKIAVNVYSAIKKALQKLKYNNFPIEGKRFGYYFLVAPVIDAIKDNGNILQPSEFKKAFDNFRINIIFYLDEISEGDLELRKSMGLNELTMSSLVRIPSKKINAFDEKLAKRSFEAICNKRSPSKQKEYDSLNAISFLRSSQSAAASSSPGLSLSSELPRTRK